MTRTITLPSDGSALVSSVVRNQLQLLENEITVGTDPGHLHSISSISATGTPSSGTFLRGDGTWAAGGTGTVTSVSVVTANGFSGSIATATTTPAITITTSLTAKSVPFVGGSSNLTEDTTNFTFDSTSKQLRLGSSGSPSNYDSRVHLLVVNNVNDYGDVSAQNQNAGDSATTDFFTSADNDSSTLVGHYTDFGITSSGWNPATAGNIKTVSVNAAGTGYSVGNVLTISTGGDGNGQVTVATIGGGGSVTSVTLSNNGTGYVAGSGYSTTGGGGSGCTINVLILLDYTIWTANDGYLFNSGGNLIISTDTVGKVIKFSVVGTGTTNEVGRFTTTGLTVGLAGTTKGILTFSGNTSGTTLLQPAAAASGTLTLPAATDTLVGLATTDTLINKTLTSPKINENVALTTTATKLNLLTSAGGTTGTTSTNIVFSTSPSLTTPTLGVATATSINGNTFTTGTYTLTGTAGKTLNFTNTITFSGTDSTTMTFPSTTATIARTDAAQTFTGTQTFSQVNKTANAIAASSNAATVPITSGHNIVTNSSAATLTITLTTASAVNMQTCIVQVLDFSAVAQTITWVNTENSTISAPTTSNGSTTLPLSIGFIYNSATSKWRCVASA